jgi:hypothetical protein
VGLIGVCHTEGMGLIGVCNIQRVGLIGDIPGRPMSRLPELSTGIGATDDILCVCV